MTREEVIKELQHCIDCYPICEAPCDEALEIAIDSLKKDTRPKGHWDMINNFIAGEYRPYAYMCSECGFEITSCRGLSQDIGHNLFCQHCGADMR